MSVTLERAKEILGLPTMTLSGRITEIKAATTKAGKPYFKLSVVQRSDNKIVSLYLWNASIIDKFQLGNSYDFDVDYSDREMKYRQINDAVAVTYAGDDIGGPGDDQDPTIEYPSAAQRTAPATQKTSQGSYGKNDNDIHIIRESALKSAAQFLCRPGLTEQVDEDDLIFIASKLEDYIKNGAVL